MPTDKRARQKEGRAARQQALLEAQRRQQRRSRVIRLFIPIGVLAAAAVFFANRNSGDDTNVSTKTSTALAKAKPVKGTTLTGDTPCPPATPAGAPKRVAKFAKAPPNCLDPTKSYTALFDTTEGQIRVFLDTAKAPMTVNNFVVLARYHYYDGSAIFRTDPSIDIIQGGGPTTQSNTDPGPGYTIPDEGDAATRKYAAGDLVMARTSQPNSGGAQFFFVTGPKASALDGGQGPTGGTYVTFGTTRQGLDVIKQILALNKKDPSSGLGGAPKRTVLVRKVTILQG